MPERTALFHGLLCDALLAQPEATAGELVTRREQLGLETDSDLFGPPLVDDRRLAELNRNVTGEPVPVTVLNSSGAGGLVSLARRSFDHLRPTAVETLVRDRDDPAANIARIAVAAEELDSGTDIFVGAPADLDHARIAEEIEGNGLSGLITGDGLDPATICTRMSTCVELDLAFRIGPGAAASVDAQSETAVLLAVMMALDALIDGAEVADATRLLDDPAAAEPFSILDSDEARVQRVRRRLAGFDLQDPYAVAAEVS